jgi:hypothetical protein
MYSLSEAIQGEGGEGQCGAAPRVDEGERHAASGLLHGLAAAARSLGDALRAHGGDVLPQGTLGTLRPLPPILH